MFGKRFTLFKVFGFDIGIDLSWFFIVLFITWTLAKAYFPSRVEGLPDTTYWIMGATGALGLFASVLLHELGHAVAARGQGVEMRRITLFIFGGVAEMKGEPKSPMAEFIIAIAGPIVSALLAGALLGAGVVLAMSDMPPSATAVVNYLGFINGLLVVFNMIPAFPLDGGRVLRSALWAWKGDVRWATRITSGLGALFGAALIALGLLFAFRGMLVQGVWWFLLGIFLRNAARMSYQHVIVRRALEGEPVRRFMRADPITVPPDLTIDGLVHDYFETHFHKMFPVVDSNAALVGCVTVRDVGKVSREAWRQTPVRDVMTSCAETNTISPDADAMAAMARMSEQGVSRLMVVDGAMRLLGVLTLRDLLQFLSLRVELEGE